jgi:hypothetical protein
VQHRQRRRVTQVVRGRLEGQAPDRHRQRVGGVSRGPAHLIGHQVELSLVGGYHLFEQGEVVAVVRGDADEGAGVFGEARPTPTRPGRQVVPPDAAVVAHPLDDVHRIGPDRLAQDGYGIDEGDLGRQEGVAGILDGLGRGRIGDEDRCPELPVQGDQLRRRFGVLAPDDDPVGVEPVLDGVTLPQELWVGHHRRIRPAQRGDDRAGRADGDGGLGDDDRARLEVGGDLAGRLGDEAEIGGAIGTLRCRHAEEDEVRAGACLRHVGGKRQATGSQPFPDQIRQALLEDRGFPPAQHLDLGRVDVDGRHAVAQVG